MEFFKKLGRKVAKKQATSQDTVAAASSQDPVAAASSQDPVAIPEPVAKPITAVVIGCGQRGRCYSQFALIRPGELRIVAAADPRPSARGYMRRTFDLPVEAVLDDWRELMARGRLADAALICTQDQLHLAPCQACKRLGYHVLLEKPMSVHPLDCVQMVHRDWLSRPDQLMVVCHVLRYLPAVRKLHELIRSGAIGRLCHVQHTEPVGFAHFAHSFVRGNWRNEATSAFSLLTKCCHDVDLLCYWMPSRCARVSSFGSLLHFRPEEKPPGAADRCTECAVEAGCPYSAVKAYQCPGLWSPDAFVDREETVGDPDKHRRLVREALETGPYGRCVYSCDNDVCDHQVVNLEFEDGATASLTMTAFTAKVCVRSSVFYGTRGELRWNGASFGDEAIEHFDFLSLHRAWVPVEGETAEGPGGQRMRGHGSADFFLIQEFVRTLLNARDNTSSLSEMQRHLEESTLYGHLVAFAAEESRRRGSVVSVAEYIAGVMRQLDFERSDEAAVVEAASV